MKNIRIIVDQPVNQDHLPAGEKHARSPLAALVSKAQISVIEMNTQTLSDGLQNIYSGLVDSVRTLQRSDDEVEIDNIQFSMGIDSSGQVSLLSTVSASNQYKTGITFTVRFKKTGHDQQPTK